MIIRACGIRLSTVSGEVFVNHVCCLLQPVLPCRFVAVGNDPEHLACEGVHAAEGEDAVAPDAFQRVAKDVLFAPGGGIRGVEDQGGFGRQLTDGQAAAVTVGGRGVGVFPQNTLYRL